MSGGTPTRCPTCGVRIGEGGLCHCPDAMEKLVDDLRDQLAIAAATAEQFRHERDKAIRERDVLSVQCKALTEANERFAKARMRR